MGGHYQPRIYARVAIFGFWTAVLGGVTLLVVGHTLARSSRSEGALAAAGFSIGGLFVGALASLFEAGLVSVGLGGTMMLGGSLLLFRLP